MRVNRVPSSLKHDLRRALQVGGVVVVSIAAVAVTTHSTSSSVPLLSAALAAALPLFPLVLGSAIVLAAGELDLSVAGGVTLYGMLALLGVRLGLPFILVLGAQFLIAAVAGYFVGKAVVRLQRPALVITLAGAFVFYGLALLIDVALRRDSEMSAIQHGALIVAYRTITPAGVFVGFNYAFAWSLLLLISALVLRYRTRLGLEILAVGANRDSALKCGIGVASVKQRVFVASAVGQLLAADIMLVNYQRGGWSPDAAKGLELAAIAVCVIGGTSVNGGSLYPLSLSAALFLWTVIAQLQYFVPGVGAETQQLALGIILLSAVILARTGRAGGSFPLFRR